MALRGEVFIDTTGEYYAIGNLTEKYTGTEGSGLSIGAFGRDSRKGIRVTYGPESGPPFNHRFYKTMASSDPWAITSFAFRRNAAQTVPVSLAQFFAPGASFANLTLAQALDGSLILVLGELGFFGYTTLATSDGFGLDEYVHLEWINKMAGSGGSSAVYLNGSDTPILTYSGNTGANSWGSCSWGVRIFNNIGLYGAARHDYCDICLRSSLTDYGTDPLGDTEALCLKSVADSVQGPGVYQEFTPSAGTDHGALVDDAVEDGDATTLTSLVGGTRESLHHEQLPSTGSSFIYFDQVVSAAKKATAGSALVNGFVRSAGVNHDGEANVALGTSYVHVRTVLQKYGASTITPSLVNASETGIVIG